MPLARIARTRESLPVGYRFGDGKYTPEQVIAARFIERRTSVFRLGLDLCASCGTTGRYDCPQCGCWSAA